MQASEEPEALTEKEIAQLAYQGQIALAARCALRSLPLTGYEGHFDFWGEEAKVHMRSIEAAVLAAALEGAGKKVHASVAEDALEYAHRALDASDAAATSSSIDAGDAIADIYRAVYAAITPNSTREIHTIILGPTIIRDASVLSARADFVTLIELGSDTLVIFDKPLWQAGLPRGWEEILSNWQRGLESLDVGETYRRYAGFMAGSPDWAASEHAVYTWHDEYAREVEPSERGVEAGKWGNVASESGETKFDSPNSQPDSVDLTRFELEKHVDRSFRTASALAQGQPISASHMLSAALIVSREKSSPAFSMLRSLLPLPGLDQRSTEDPSSIALDSLQLDSSLSVAWSVAEPFLIESKNSIWGRDYVTTALLAAGDLSLDELAMEAGTTLAVLRNAWYQFVTTSEQSHRNKIFWDKWWNAAGVALPDENNEPKTYLLTWNPSLHPYSSFEGVVKKVKKEGTAVLGWSTGNRKTVSKGERVFLMRQGIDPLGLIGSGRIINDSIEVLPHWDKNKAKQGKTYNRVSVLWDFLQEKPFISFDNLKAQTGEEKIWKSWSSGVEIPKAAAKRLEGVWEAAIQSPTGENPQTSPPATLFPRAWLGADAIPVIGRDKDYRPSEHDSLDVEEQAKIFASLTVAENVTPPFAIGLLGDWGVGKTFFMRLMQENIKSTAGKGSVRGQNIGTVSRVAQIEFNAWHYVDSDLWASLASHLFDGLSEELSAKGEKVEDIRRELRRTINSSKREHDETNAVIGSAKKMRIMSAKKLERAQKKRAFAEEAREHLSRQRIWKFAIEDNSDPNIAELKAKAMEVSDMLGIDSLMNSTEDVERIYSSMSELSRRGAGLATFLDTAFTGKRIYSSVAVVAAVVAVAVIGPMLLETVAKEESTLAIIGAPLIQLAAVIGTATAWVGKNVKRVSSAMRTLEKMRDELRKPHDDTSCVTKEETKLKKQIKCYDAIIAAEEQRIEEADRQISEAQAEIQRINAGGLVYDFLNGRVKDSRYLDRLGLISVIRRDFEELGALLRDWRKHGRLDGNVDNISNQPSNKAPIERIILYIDDLDRCPPKRVVEVLQAVHLLLAFDLFVVVVAVDARWLERALNEAYNPLTETLDGSSQAESMHRFSAHNYLEKIFQIPFSLPRMQEVGYRDLIGRMVAEPRMHANKAIIKDTPADQHHPQITAPMNNTDEDRDLNKPTGKGPADAAKLSVSSDLKKVFDVKTNNPVAEVETRTDKDIKDRKNREQEEEDLRRKEVDERNKRQQEEAAERISAMLLMECEEQFMTGLYRFIDTPRLAKRLVNIYRLIRVRAASIEKDFSTFTDRDTGSYRAVLLLLAISVGRTDSAPEILEDLHKATGESFSAWLADQAICYHNEGVELKNQRLASFKNSRINSPKSDPECLLENLQRASTNILDDMKAVSTALDEIKAPPLDDRLMIYTSWAREVGRYSFRWHLKPKSQYLYT